MSNERIKNNSFNGTRTTSCEGVSPSMHGIPDPASAGRNQATYQAKVVKKIVTECWIRSQPKKRKYRQRMKKIWDEIGFFPVTEQILADQAKQIRTNK